MIDLSKEQRTITFNLITNILLGDTYGSSNRTNSDVYKERISIDYKGFNNISFIGYASDDVDAFVNIILNSEYSSPPIRELILFKFPQFHMETSLGNNIYALAVDSIGFCYMVGGMTDYSGSGGAAYRKFQLIIEFLRELYDIEFKVVPMARGAEVDLNQLINKEFNENN